MYGGNNFKLAYLLFIGSVRLSSTDMNKQKYNQHWDKQIYELF